MTKETGVLRVLLVSEEAELIDCVRDALIEEAAVGAQLTIVERLSEALTLAQLRWFDVVLLDVRVPDVGAPLALTNVRLAAPRLPLVVITSEGHGPMVERLVEAGALDTVPCSALMGTGIARALRCVTERHRLSAELRRSESRRENATRTRADAERRLRRESALRDFAIAALDADSMRSLEHHAVRCMIEALGAESARVIELSRAGERTDAAGQLTVVVRGERGPMAVLAVSAAQDGALTEEDTHFLGCLADALAAAMDRLAREQARADFLDASPVLYCALNPNGRVMTCAGDWHAVLGRSGESISGKPIVDVVAAESAEAVRRLLAGNRSDGAGTGSVEIACVQGDGTLRPMRWTVMHRSDAGEVRLVLEDATTSHALRERFAAGLPFEALGVTTGIFAHDFCNALTAILGHADLLLESVSEPDPRREDLLDIRNAAEGAAALTKRLLLLSRSVSADTAELNRVATDVAGLVDRIVGVRIDVQLNQAAGRLRAHIGDAALGRILLHLAIRARESMPRGGRLTISTHSATNEAGTRSVVLTVADTGSGTGEKTRNRPLDPFSPGFGHADFGLDAVRTAVERAGGRLETRGDPEHGATIEIHLPAIETTPIGKRPASPARPTVLIVEDEDGVRAIARRILERAGYTVLAAATPAEALTRVSEYEGKIELLLTDLVMPGMAGGELATALRRQLPELRVIYMSGYVEDTILERLRGTTEGGFLGKPFSPETLFDAVEAALAEPGVRASSAA